MCFRALGLWGLRFRLVGLWGLGFRGRGDSGSWGVISFWRLGASAVVFAVFDAVVVVLSVRRAGFLGS